MKENSWLHNLFHLITLPYLGLGRDAFMVFFVLKVLNKIDWRWWWVASPVWASVFLGALILIFEPSETEEEESAA